jgi:ergothioneine biosynthesis protein EgtB
VITVDRNELRLWLMRVRASTEALAEPLSVEDQQIQSMPDASPTKWHLAHTSWFFDELVLKPNTRRYEAFDARYSYLFNSYYDSVGHRHPRAARGLLSRPSLEEVRAYRRHVDEALARLLEDQLELEVERAIILGINHEQQHQELILTDIKHALGTNPLRPAYAPAAAREEQQLAPALFVSRDAGIVKVGHAAPGFAFDNEMPEHRSFLEAYEIGDRLVTVGEYLEFIRDGGYARPELWLAEARSWIEGEQIGAPLYWAMEDDDMRIFDLRGGARPANLAEPVCHVSYYEADAYARWAGGRLPTEAEWEAVAVGHRIAGNLLDGGRLHPLPATQQPGRFRQLFGDVWEWTQSAYGPYPGYRTPVGAFGEYNGKFMCNQFVLRGGSCLTPFDHLRHTYRNFFPAGARWQMSGFRLARSRVD